jgi:hypothetical protein
MISYIKTMQWPIEISDKLKKISTGILFVVGCLIPEKAIPY